MNELKFVRVAPHWLAALIAQLEKNIGSAKPPLSATPLDTDTYREAAKELFDPRVFTISDASIEHDDVSATIKGNASLFGQSALPVELSYCSIDGGCFLQFTASPFAWAPLAPLTKLGLPLSGFKVIWVYGPLATSADQTPVTATSRVAFGATAKIGKMLLPVVIVPAQKPDTGNLWSISGDFDALPLDGLQALLQWFQETTAFKNLPQLGGLSGLALSGLEFSFDPDAVQLNSGLITIQSTSPWPVIADRIVLSDALVSLGFFVAQNNAVEFYGEITAVMALGDSTLLVTVDEDTSTGIATLKVISDDAQLPNFAALAKMAGLPKLATMLPTAVSDLSGLLIEDFRIELDTKTGKIDSLSLALTYPDEVTVFAGTALENLHLRLELAPQDATPVTGSITGLLAVAGDYIGLQGDLGDSFSLSGTMALLPLSALATHLSLAIPKELPTINLQNLLVQASSDGSIHFDASVDIDFNVLAKTLKMPIPDGMANITLSSLTFDLDVGAGTWNIALSTPQSFAFPFSGEHKLDLHGINLQFGVGASKKFAVGGEFDLSGSVSVGSDINLTLTGDGLHAVFGDAANWKVVGAAEVTVFGSKYTDWEASIDQQTFGLQHSGDISVFDWDVASATIKSLNIAVTRKQAGKAKDSPWGFDIIGSGAIDIPGILNATGHLELDTSTHKLVLSTKNPKIPSIPLASPVTMDLELHELKLSHDADWKFASAATVKLSNVPKPLQQYIPATRQGTLDISKEGVTLTCRTDDWHMDFGPLAIKIADKEILLGEPKIDPLKLAVTLGKKPSFEVHLRVTIPNELNRLLGWDAKFQPTTVFLNPSIDLGLKVSPGGIGLALENGTSPLKALKPDTEGFFNWDLGDVGMFRFKMPTLTFEGDSWKGSFGMTHGPIAVPLQPVKFLMRQLSVPGTHYVPDALPIPKNIDMTKLATALPELVGQDVWKALPKDVAVILKELFKAIGAVAGDVTKKYPADFVDYLTLHIPDTIFVDVDTAGPAFTLRTDDKEALKFLLPWFAAMPPGLAGFNIKSVTFGQLFGTLGLLTLDGHIDYFDIVTLIVSALPGVNATGFRNRITADNLTAVVPSAFPFPIPLFYDDLSWQINSWTGLGFTTDWKSKVDFDFFKTGGALFSFFTDKNYLLSQDAKDAFDIKFQIGPNFIALPGYVGGGDIGQTKDATPPLPAGDSLKRLLDTLKTGDLTHLITAIPLHDKDQKVWYRLGVKKGSVNFGPLTFSAGVGWCITTQDELVKEILPNAKATAILGDLNGQDVLQSLPTNAATPAYKKGFVVMLMGEAGVAPIIAASAYFGMALTGASKYAPDNEGGFESGFVLQGKIAELLALRIQGNIHVVRSGTTTIEGNCSLTFAGTILIDAGASVTVGKDLFELKVILSLVNDICTIQGCFHIGPDKVAIGGTFIWKYAPGYSLKLGASAIFDANGFSIGLNKIKLFGANADLILRADARHGGRIGASASLDVSQITGPFTRSFAKVANDIGRTAKSAESSFQKALKEYQGNMSTAQLLGTVLKKIAKDLPSAAANEAYKAAPNGFKKIARNKAKSVAAKIAKDLNNLSAKLMTADAKRAKNLIIGLIDRVLAARVKITLVGIIPFYNKSIWSYAAAKPYKTKLQNARDYIEKIPAQKLVQNNAKAIWKKYVGQLKIADEIATAAKQGVGNIPQITAMNWENYELTKLCSTSTVSIMANYKNKKVKVASAPFDLNNPVSSALGLAQAVVSAIGEAK